MYTLTRQCFNHQPSCSRYKVHFISSWGLEAVQQARPSLPSSSDHFVLPPPSACIHPPQHSRSAGCVTPAGFQTATLLTQLPAWKKQAQKRVQRGQCQESTLPLYRRTRGICQRHLPLGREQVDRGLPPSTLLLRALVKLVLCFSEL